MLNLEKSVVEAEMIGMITSIHIEGKKIVLEEHLAKNIKIIENDIKKKLEKCKVSSNCFLVQFFFFIRIIQLNNLYYI